ncbi:hypothetical protein KDK95_05315 [Actinospica sp. MGRD01-02]|uniref:Uncharacterized protein n=1 Tax=Actinospica acidithermotolerans TaxID=2828514 RepID=A0A941II16_9ACTN|nr:hypothetical protein [Actinospica acidithermotolerans]MBR7825718.1 hypothetical protein [Actinospica acidithermotolerans]
MLGTLNQPDRLRCPARSGGPVGPGSRSTRIRLGRAYVAAGLLMIPWVLFLSRTLPAGATDCHWALAWVGVDSSEALALFATGWLLLRADNRCVLAATAAAVLLLTDAWLDLTSAASRGELLIAIAMAVFAEVPIAIACAALALRLTRHPFPPAAETAGTTDKQEEQRCL